jgi:hypothetical protein
VTPLSRSRPIPHRGRTVKDSSGVPVIVDCVVKCTTIVEDDDVAILPPVPVTELDCTRPEVEMLKQSLTFLDGPSLESFDEQGIEKKSSSAGLRMSSDDRVARFYRVRTADEVIARCDQVVSMYSSEL